MAQPIRSLAIKNLFSNVFQLMSNRINYLDWSGDRVTEQQTRLDDINELSCDKSPEFSGYNFALQDFFGSSWTLMPMAGGVEMTIRRPSAENREPLHLMITFISLSAEEVKFYAESDLNADWIGTFTIKF